MSALRIESPVGLAGALRGAAEQGMRQRSVRVIALVLAVAIVSLADLYLTLTYLHGAGMHEANPLARWIMSYNCSWLLAGWKLMLLGVTCSILYVTRHSRSAEVAAWVCCGVMLWLAGQWTQYADKAPALTPEIHQLANGHAPDWVQFSSSSQ